MSDELKQFLIQLDLLGVKLPFTCWPWSYFIDGNHLVRNYLGDTYYKSRSYEVDEGDYHPVLKRIIDKRRSCERQREGT